MKVKSWNILNALISYTPRSLTFGFDCGVPSSHHSPRKGFAKNICNIPSHCCCLLTFDIYVNFPPDTVQFSDTATQDTDLVHLSFNLREKLDLLSVHDRLPRNRTGHDLSSCCCAAPSSLLTVIVFTSFRSVQSADQLDQDQGLVNR